MTLKVEQLMSSIDPVIAEILNDAMDSKDISANQAVSLFDATGTELNAIVMVADMLRKKSAGDRVTYVVNRNINFTNVCIKRCGFCAFSRDFRNDEGYFLPVEEIVRELSKLGDLGLLKSVFKQVLLLALTEICTLLFVKR